MFKLFKEFQSKANAVDTTIVRSFGFLKNPKKKGNVPMLKIAKDKKSKPKTPYFNFLAINKDEWRSELCDATPVERLKHARTLWSSLTATEKKVFFL
jgi:hypothetical protein